MKYSRLSAVAGALIFAIILFASAFVLLPVYKKADGELRALESRYLSLAEQRTGLKISYKSLSPSILSNFTMRGISVIHGESGIELASIKKASLSYNLAKIISGDYEHAFYRLTVNSVRVDYTREARLLFEGHGKSRNRTMDSRAELDLDRVEDAIRNFARWVPFDVSFKNLTLCSHLEDGQRILGVRHCSVKKDSGGQAEFIRGEGNVLVSLKSGKTAGFVWKMDGNMPYSVSGSSFRIRLDDYQKADYSIRKVDFILSYRYKKAMVRAIESRHPLSLAATYDMENRNLEAQVKTNMFNPLAVARAPVLPGQVEFFKGLKVTTDSSFAMDLKTMDYSWNTDSEFFLPKGKRFTRDGQTVFLDAFGDRTDVTVNQLQAEGGIFNGTFKGSFNIPRLQPSGTLDVRGYVFGNGNVLSVRNIKLVPRRTKGFDFYFENAAFGSWCTYSDFKCYASLGKNIDLTLEAWDYSHEEYGIPGHITANATMQLGEGKNLEAYANLDNFFVDTGLKTACFFTDGTKPVVSPVLPVADPYISQVEAYFSTDFKDFTYNSPAALFANTRKDREVLVVSFDGTGTSLSFSRIELIAGQNNLIADGTLDIDPRSSQLSFYTDLTFNTLPYTLNGVYAFGDWLSVTGSYGLDAQLNFGKLRNGTVRFEEFPARIGKYMVSLSSDFSYIYSDSENWSGTISRLSVMELTDNMIARPAVSLEGSFTQDSLVASAISYTDSFSSLDGSGYALWNYAGGIFDSCTFSMSIRNSLGDEDIEIGGEVRNHSGLGLRKCDVRSDLYFSAGASVRDFPLGRFLVGQGNGNTVSFNANVTGTIENPLVSVDVYRSSVLLGGSNLNSRLNLSFIDGVMDVSDADIQWKDFRIDGVSSRIDLEDFYGDAELHFKYETESKKIDTRLSLQLANLSGENAGGIPEEFSVDAECSLESSNFIKKFEPFHVSFIRSLGRLDIFTDEHLGAYGEIIDDGRMSFAVAEGKPLSFLMNGNVRDQVLDLDVRDFNWDIGKISYTFNSNVFSLYSGILKGDFRIQGNVTDPVITGNVSMLDSDFNLPQYIPGHFTADEIPVWFAQEEISVPETLFLVNGGEISGNAFVVLDRWSLSTISINLRTLDGKDIPIDSRVSHFRIKGYTSADVNIVIEDRNVTLGGSISLRNSELSYSINDYALENSPVKELAELSDPRNLSRKARRQKAEEKKALKKEKRNRKQQPDESIIIEESDASSPGIAPALDFNINLDIMVGQKVQIDINPLLRSLIAPSTPISLVVDTSTGLWSVKGDIVLKGGEISYLSRNFYLKQGRLVLNETQSRFDPVVTVRAETRERDSSGEQVIITMTAIAQNVSTFQAVLSSIPGKPEQEIMELLGQVLRGDSTSVGSFVISGVDYGVQMTLLRKAETALRDLCNFDIFSIRTTALQNTIMQGLDIGSRAENRSVIGNLFDNSTVYIGKYFGNDIYVDALLHWSYDKAKASSVESVGNGLVFQPEIGLEFEAPFANIRWNFSPNLSDLQESWAKANSVTLSWRLEF